MGFKEARHLIVRGIFLFTPLLYNYMEGRSRWGLPEDGFIFSKCQIQDGFKQG